MPIFFMKAFGGKKAKAGKRTGNYEVCKGDLSLWLFVFIKNQRSVV
jgi:hypothetical protein